MTMLPNNGYDINAYSEPTLSPSYTWKLDPNKERVAGFIDELDSVEQACFMALKTEMGKYKIYPEDYGIQMNDLYGVDRNIVNVVLPQRIKECLLMDRRINDVFDITLEFVGSQCRVRLKVDCIFGMFESEVEYENL